MSTATDPVPPPVNWMWESQGDWPFEHVDPWTSSGYDDGLWNSQAPGCQSRNLNYAPPKPSQPPLNGMMNPEQYTGNHAIAMTSPAVPTPGLDHSYVSPSEPDSPSTSLLSQGACTASPESSGYFNFDVPSSGRDDQISVLTPAETPKPATPPSPKRPTRAQQRRPKKKKQQQQQQQHHHYHQQQLQELQQHQHLLLQQQYQQQPPQEGGFNIAGKPTRERNRIAADKYRSRQRNANQNLESYTEELEQTNKQLSQASMKLSEELCTLKHMLLAHSNCDCELIQKYLRSSALKWVNQRSEGARNTRESNT